MIVSVSNWIDDGLVAAFFFVRALPLRPPASRWIFSLLTSNCFYHLFYVFVHGGLRQESMKIDRRIGLLKTGVPVFLAFSPLVCSPMSNVRADWQPVFLWPLPPDSSLPLSLPPPIPIAAQTLSHSPRPPPPPGPPRYPVFSISFHCPRPFSLVRCFAGPLLPFERKATCQKANLSRADFSPDERDVHERNLFDEHRIRSTPATALATPPTRFTFPRIVILHTRLDRGTLPRN